MPSMRSMLEDYQYVWDKAGEQKRSTDGKLQIQQLVAVLNVYANGSNRTWQQRFWNRLRFFRPFSKTRTFHSEINSILKSNDSEYEHNPRNFDNPNTFLTLVLTNITSACTRKENPKAYKPSGHTAGLYLFLRRILVQEEIKIDSFVSKKLEAMKVNIDGTECTLAEAHGKLEGKTAEDLPLRIYENPEEIVTANAEESLNAKRRLAAAQATTGALIKVVDFEEKAKRNPVSTPTHDLVNTLGTDAHRSSLDEAAEAPNSTRSHNEGPDSENVIIDTQNISKTLTMLQTHLPKMEMTAWKGLLKTEPAAADDLTDLIRTADCLQAPGVEKQYTPASLGMLTAATLAQLNRKKCKGHEFETLKAELLSQRDTLFEGVEKPKKFEARFDNFIATMGKCDQELVDGFGKQSPTARTYILNYFKCVLELAFQYVSRCSSKKKQERFPLIEDFAQKVMGLFKQNKSASEVEKATQEAHRLAKHNNRVVKQHATVKGAPVPQYKIQVDAATQAWKSAAAAAVWEKASISDLGQIEVLAASNDLQAREDEETVKKPEKTMSRTVSLTSNRQEIYAAAQKECDAKAEEVAKLREESRESSVSSEADQRGRSTSDAPTPPLRRKQSSSVVKLAKLDSASVVPMDDTILEEETDDEASVESSPRSSTYSTDSRTYATPPGPIRISIAGAGDEVDTNKRQSTHAVRLFEPHPTNQGVLDDIASLGDDALTTKKQTKIKKLRAIAQKNQETKKRRGISFDGFKDELLAITKCSTMSDRWTKKGQAEQLQLLQYFHTVCSVARDYSKGSDPQKAVSRENTLITPAMNQIKLLAANYDKAHGASVSKMASRVETSVV